MAKFNFKQFFQEDNENYSATRLAFVFWAFGLLGVWIYQACFKPEITIFKGDNSAVLWILVTLMGGKVVQKFKENPKISANEDVKQ